MIYRVVVLNLTSTGQDLLNIKLNVFLASEAALNSREGNGQNMFTGSEI
jgi:hypothetical protein